MVDPWRVPDTDSPYARSGDLNAKWTQEQWDEIYEGAAERTRPYLYRRSMMRMTSAEALPQIPEESLDLVFIDGDHSYEGVKIDLGWWDKVKPGGIFCGHDYKSRGRKWSGVVRAVDEWAESQKLTIGLVGLTIWWVQKPEEN
jgi:predicted O-methyltransferase YrrM